MFIGELKEKKGPWMLPNDVITSKKIQITKAGKKNNLSFFLWSLIFVGASRAGIRCSHEQTGARSNDREYQQQFRVYGEEN